MTESQKLSILRDKLIRRRRSLVEGYQSSPTDPLSGDELVQVQNEIEAVDRALAEKNVPNFDSDHSLVPFTIQEAILTDMNRKELLITTQKARRINFDTPIYGTFAEIGAGQEAAPIS
jgi:hypothetical protein